MNAIPSQRDCIKTEKHRAPSIYGFTEVQREGEERWKRKSLLFAKADDDKIAFKENLTMSKADFKILHRAKTEY
jgi:hypothetical protein